MRTRQLYAGPFLDAEMDSQAKRLPLPGVVGRSDDLASAGIKNYSFAGRRRKG
jgi:hypothetical protein